MIIWIGYLCILLILLSLPFALPVIGDKMIVRDLGPPDAKIMLVGEAPGAEEEKHGVPFCGPAGAMLKQMLSHSGINFNDCYVTNVVNSRPPNNDFKYFYNTKLLEDSIQQLRNKIEAIKPSVVIPLGAEPLAAICNKYKISNWRGTWLSFRGINVLPTYHPSYILQVYGDHVIVELDFKKALTQKPADEPSMLIAPTLQQSLDWIVGVQSSCSRIAFDIETVGKHTRCIAFASDNTAVQRSLCIPFIKFASSNLSTVGGTMVTMSGSSQPGSYWSSSDEVIVIDAISNLFSDKRIQFVGHNSISFDEPILQDEFGLSIQNHYIDTMHAFHCLYSELPKGLDFLCSILTNYPNYWTEKDSNNDSSEWKYNCYDAIVTLDCSFIIEKELGDINV